MGRRLGFSLVELVVIVGVLCVITSLLLPVLEASRMRAQSAVCQSNLHRVGVGLQAYHTAHDLFIPSDLLGGVPAPARERGGWLVPVAHAYERPGAPGMHFTDFCDPGVLSCPAARGTGGLSYGLNGRLAEAGRRARLRQDPAETPVVFDARLARGYFYSDLAFRHLGEANILYADYHVSTRRFDVALRFPSATPLPGLRTAAGVFSLVDNVIVANVPAEADIAVVGGAYGGESQVSVYYRRNGGKAILLGRGSCRQDQGDGAEGVDSDDLGGGPGGPTGSEDPSGSFGDEVRMAAGDTLMLLARVKGLHEVACDDGSGNVIALRRGEVVPGVALLDADVPPEWLRPHVAPDGTVTVPSNAVLFLFSLQDAGGGILGSSMERMGLAVLVTLSEATAQAS